MLIWCNQGFWRGFASARSASQLAMLLHHSFDGEVISSSCQLRVGNSTCCRLLLEINARHEQDRLVGIVSGAPFLFGDLPLFQHLHGASPPRNSMISLWMCWEGLICLRRFGLWIFNCIVKSASAPSYEKDISQKCREFPIGTRFFGQWTSSNDFNCFMWIFVQLSLSPGGAGIQESHLNGTSHSQKVKSLGAQEKYPSYIPRLFRSYRASKISHLYSACPVCL